MKKFRIAVLCLVVLAMSMLCLTACQKVVTITFKTQGGEMQHPTDISVKYGETVELPVPTRSDSEFIGWFLGRSPEAEQVTDKTTYKKDTILYARWKTYGSEGLEFEINEFNNGAICVGIGTFEGNFLEIPAWYEDLPVVKIKEHAFQQNTMLVGVKLPEKLQEIGAYAFERCTNLTEIELNDSLVSIGDWAFVYTRLSEIDFPDTLKTIGVEAFYVSKLTHVTIPNTVTDIGEYAFAFTELEEVTFEENSSLTVIPKGLFVECDKLTSIEFPDSVTTIGGNALNKCFNLQSIVIPNSVETIEYGAFYNCTALRYLFIPASVEVMGFNILSEENEVIVCCEAKSQPSTWSLNWNSNYDNVYWDALELQEEGDFVVVKNDRNVRLIEYVGEKTDVVVPSEINGLEVVGFKNIFAENTELVSIVVSEGITSLEEGAFRNCSSLVSVSLPSTIESIGKYVFQGCNSLETLIVDENNKHFSDSGNCLISIESKTLLFGFKNSVIPADGSVVALASNCFEEVPIEYIEIPSSVKSIGYRAFACSSLRNYTFEQPLQLQEIGVEAFYMCEKLETINIPETLVILGSSAFRNCFNVQSVLGGSDNYQVVDGQLVEVSSGTLLKGIVSGSLIVEDGINQIAEQAFYGNKELSEVVLPDSIETVGFAAFAQCDALTSMTMPFVGNSRYNYKFLGYMFGGATTVDNAEVCPQSLKKVVLTDIVEVTSLAFYGCSYIEEVQVPNDVYFIGYSSFENCGSLTTFNMPSQLQKVYDRAFKGCTSLESVEFPDTLTSIGYMAFAETTSLDSVVIPLSVEFIDSYAFETSGGKTVNCQAVQQPTGWNSNWDSGVTVVWGYNNIEESDYSYILKDDGLQLTDYRGTDTHVRVGTFHGITTPTLWCGDTKAKM